MKPLSAFALVALVACGDAASIGPDRDATAPTDASDATYVFGDASPNDVSFVPSDVGLVDGGGVFPCGNCTCDGRTQYCNDSQGPHAPIVDASDFDGCTGGWGVCLPLPDGCAPPTCACLPNETKGSMCSCFRSDAGDGLVAGCWYP